MDSCLFIGSKVDKDTAENLASFVDKIFASGKANGMEGASREEVAKAIASSPKISSKRARCAIVTQGSQPVILSTVNAEG